MVVPRLPISLATIVHLPPIHLHPYPCNFILPPSNLQPFHATLPLPSTLLLACILVALSCHPSPPSLPLSLTCSSAMTTEIAAITLITLISQAPRQNPHPHTAHRARRRRTVVTPGRPGSPLCSDWLPGPPPARARAPSGRGWPGGRSLGSHQPSLYPTYVEASFQPSALRHSRRTGSAAPRAPAGGGRPDGWVLRYYDGTVTVRSLEVPSGRAPTALRCGTSVLEVTVIVH